MVLTSDEKKLKEDVEWARNLEDLKILREIAMKSVPLPDTTNGKSAGRSLLLRWFPQWMGWYSATPSETASQLEGEIFEVRW